LKTDQIEKRVSLKKMASFNQYENDKKRKVLDEQIIPEKEHLEYLVKKSYGYDKSDQIKKEIEKLKKTLSLHQSMLTIFDVLPSEFIEQETVDFNDRHMKMKELLAIDSRISSSKYKINNINQKILLLNKILNDLAHYDESKLKNQQKVVDDIQAQITANYAAQREYERSTPHIFRGGHCGACTFGGTGHVCGMNY